MTHEEQRIWLIKKLLSERIEYRRYKIPEDEQEQKRLLRSLMNMRMPLGISEDFLKIQDEYLQVENAREGFVDIHDLKPVSADDRLYLWQGDITRLKVDAIVNAANSQMLGCLYPFWAMSLENANAIYACLNFDEAFCPKQIEKQSICIDGDAGELVKALR